MADTARTPWTAGRLDGRSGPPRLLFGRTFEDPAIEQAVLPEHGTIVCIAAAGDTARALATPARSVIAVDVNPAQIDEVRRRLAGDAPRGGSADRLLSIGRAALAPFGWWPSRLERFCDLEDVQRQRAEWQRLTPLAVRRMMRAALSPRVLRVAYGRPFAQLAPRAFGELLLERIGRRVVYGPNRGNAWLASLLTGAWTEGGRPGAGGSIDLRCDDVTSVLEQLPPGSIDGISLSNVLDGPSSGYRSRLMSAAHRAARPGAPIITRTLLEPSDAGARALADVDRSLIWGGVAVQYA